MRAAYFGLVPYDTALLLQEQFFYGKKVAQNAEQETEDTILFLEHPPVYTGGRSVSDFKNHVRDSFAFKEAEFFETTRGGLVTFHGPGQLVGYPIFNIGRQLTKDYMVKLRQVIIRTLFDLGITSYAQDGGLWVEVGSMRRKICSFGAAVKRSRLGNRITMHGFALNVNVDMRYFDAIYPCGSKEENIMVNLSELISDVPSLKEIARIAALHFSQIFSRQLRWIEPQELGWQPRHKPKWLRVPKGLDSRVIALGQKLRKVDLVTICEEARCPNISDCWSAGDAAIMILGDTCTRSCGFCLVKTGKPNPVDLLEPMRVAQALSALPLSHIVITSVDRDDLPDGGSSHWANVVRAVRHMSPDKTIEVLTGDFKGVQEDVWRVLDARPHVFGHNIETVQRLHKRVRPQAQYERSLKVLEIAKMHSSKPVIKSNIMLGHGESMPEVLETLCDLREVGVDIVTITQYLRPSAQHFPVIRYYSPEEFEELKCAAGDIGFPVVVAGPRVRTSYHAGEAYQKIQEYYGSPPVGG